VSLNGGGAGRGGPDVAANASGASGYPLFVAGLPDIGNGTSASAPLYAGLVAVVNAAMGAPIGFLNPKLYALGEAVCRDIDPLATNPPAGPLSNAFAGVPGYPAGPAWDACTGWGVIDGRRLVAALKHEPLIATAIADSGRFADICVGSFADGLLTINNSGFGLLIISDIVSTPDFAAPGVTSYPLIVNPGESLEVVIRFQPTSIGLKTGAISIISNDPSGPHTVDVSGEAPAPRLALAIASNGNFGDVCVGSFVDEPLIVNNSGKCLLLINNITSSSSDFLIPEILTFPIAVGVGASVSLPIRFQPSTLGPTTSGTQITLDSNDPTGPHKISVSGDAPAGKIAVTGFDLLRQRAGLLAGRAHDFYL